MKGWLEKFTIHKPLPCCRQGKGEWLSLTFRSPRLWPARFWKRLAECFANALPLVRARGAHCKTVCTRSVSNPLTMPLARGLRCGEAFGRCHWREGRAAAGAMWQRRLALAARGGARPRRPHLSPATTKGGAQRAPPSASAFASRESPSHNLIHSHSPQEQTRPRTPQRPCRTSWSHSPQA